MRSKTFHIVSLGCAKNTVDTHSMTELLQQAGYTPVEKPNSAAILIVNTCGFIQPARQESIQVLNELAQRKKANQVLIAAGCMVELHHQMLRNAIPGIDSFISTRRWMDIPKVVEDTLAKASPQRTQRHSARAIDPLVEDSVLRAAQQGASAYLKIADGCRRACAFCSIPLIKGNAVSRPPEAILKDAEALQKMGVCEINLIAQDTTDYGHDLGIKNGLIYLLERLVERVPDIPWIRVLYTYPSPAIEHLVACMVQHPQILKYLDIPLQHAHPGVLRRMNRPHNVDWVHKTLQKMRGSLPELTLRTTFIVGYPGETQKEFQTLLDFVSDIRFDHLGAFVYSFEPGTPGAALGDPIPPEIKQQRLEILMELQKKISLQNNRRLVGKTLDVLIEGSGDGLAVGRTYRDAPEIDGLVFINQEMSIGKLYPIQITGAMPHDLIGKYSKSANAPVR
ncbi:MAG: 30S ribosomal protein S12 methylthiotransferase RimO [Anaerolineae bacterium]|nr:30S ribosomal protein S12 methylthiotransferase RimO [Anaerolineae bacterium]